MKKMLLVAAVCVLSAPQAYAGSTIATRGSVVNSATVTQTAGAAAVSLIAQGERATIEAPRNDPLVVFESGAFVMPYINDSFNATRGGSVRVYDPVGSYSHSVNVDVNVDGYLP